MLGNVKIALQDGGYIDDYRVYSSLDDEGVLLTQENRYYTDKTGTEHQLTGYHAGFLIYRIDIGEYYLSRDGFYRRVMGPPICYLKHWKVMFYENRSHIAWKRTMGCQYWRMILPGRWPRHFQLLKFKEGGPAIKYIDNYSVSVRFGEVVRHATRQRR